MMKRLRTTASAFALAAVCLILIPLPSWGQEGYGAEAANSRFFFEPGKSGGDDFDYLSLKDHPDDSGVPLGGIGVGNVQFAPSGAFRRISMMNLHAPIPRSKYSSFILWDRKDGAVRLTRDSLETFGLSGVKHSRYRGLFPTAELDFDGSGLAVSPSIKAWSGLVPHNVKDSSIPAVWFEVRLESKEDTDASVAFSWEDFLGLYKDPENLDSISAGQMSLRELWTKYNGELLRVRPKVATCVEPYSAGGLKGFLQTPREKLRPVKLTFQNYVDRVFVGAEAGGDAELSWLPSTRDSEEEWRRFGLSGSFSLSPDNPAGSGRIPLSEAEEEDCPASVLAVKVRLKAGKPRTVRFLLCWWAPEMDPDPLVMPPGSFWPNGADYDKYYHNWARDLDDVVEYSVRERDRIRESSTEWQEPVLRSTMPDWLKFKLINSAYVIYTNMVLTKGGEVMVNEGGMGGLGGTMDQRLSAHPFYQKFFPTLDHSEMDIYSSNMGPEGYILHFIGHYYFGMGKVGGRTPTENGWMLDNSSSWIIQLVKDYQQTGDIERLRAHFDRVLLAIRFLLYKAPEGSSIPEGPTTYDDHVHPPLYCYYAGVWLTTLKALAVMGEAMGRPDVVAKADSLFAVSQKETIDKLWNGRWFAYGCQPDGSKRDDKHLFTGQLAGQFISRYCGWGDIYPHDIVDSSFTYQCKIPLASSEDYYAEKVWDVSKNKGVDLRGSRCWPFYLESYTAMTGIQSGFVGDGLNIMRHIQLVHLRQGWTWCQNLWNPGTITYMTAPVTWFITDVLAGASLDVPGKSIRLAPIVPGEEEVRLPLFYPRFWAELTVLPRKKEIKLRITKTFGKDDIMIDKVRCEPQGVPSDEAKSFFIKDFRIKKGRVLDLSEHYDDLTASRYQTDILK